MLNKKRKQKVIETIIGKETIIEGNITLPTSLRIDGKVYGQIDCTGDVIIGKKGYAEPSINAKRIIVAGAVKGDVSTTHNVHIHSCGKLSGNITSNGIVIDEGGIFNGISKIEASNTKNNPSDNQDLKQDNK